MTKVGIQHILSIFGICYYDCDGKQRCYNDIRKDFDDIKLNLDQQQIRVLEYILL